MLEVKPLPETPGHAELPPEGLSIAEAARRTGVSAHTLRYYERAGLLVTPTDRTVSGRRRYHRADLDWIEICTRFRAAGMPIRSIRRFADLVIAGRGNEQERIALLEEHRAEVFAKLTDMQECLVRIDRKIDFYRALVQNGDDAGRF